MPSEAMSRDSTTVASRWPKVVAGEGSVRSSAGTYTAWIEVIEPVLVEVMRSCRRPISSARGGWAPAAVFHLVVEVVALARALAHAGEHRQARVFLRDVIDQLHHVHGLAHAGAAEQADLAALGERAHQVDHLDAGLEQFLARRKLVVLGRGAVNRGDFFGADRAGFV